LAGKLEDSVNNNDHNYIKENCKNFTDQLMRLIDEYDNLTETIKKENPKPMKNKMDRATLKNLSVACENYDLETLENIILELDKFQYEEEDDLFEWLKVNVDLLNCREIIEKLTELNKKDKK